MAISYCRLIIAYKSQTLYFLFNFHAVITNVSWLGCRSNRDICNLKFFDGAVCSSPHLFKRKSKLGGWLFIVHFWKYNCLVSIV